MSDRTNTGAKSHDHLEGIHPVAHGRARRRRLFTVEVPTWRGLITHYILFFIEIGSPRVSLGGITRHSDSCWMEEVERNATRRK